LHLSLVRGNECQNQRRGEGAERDFHAQEPTATPDNGQSVSDISAIAQKREPGRRGGSTPPWQAVAA
jgi:hypothetical protein